MKNDKPLKYIAYIRKSEERKERQVLSHEAQVRKIKEQFPGLNIVKWMPQESHSAFKPGRPIFNEMMRLFESGEANALVAYHPNRASRNEIDAANVTYMLRTGVLKDLKFCSYTFENNAEGIMMLQIIMSQSQYESSKQGRDVKRGMQQKAISGERPGVVPQGYIKVPITDELGVLIKNKDKIVTRTDIDPERFVLVSKMWRMLISGLYTPRQILLIASNEWGYTVRRTAKMGGGPMGLSSIYRIFNNPFYAGWITHNGELHKGHHKTMITMDEFDKAQIILGSRGKPRLGQHEYSYTGLLKCGKCGCSVVGKTREKILASGELVKYVYYYCTRKSERRPCDQSKYTTLNSLEKDIDNVLSKFTILPEFRDLALDILRKNNAFEVTDRRKIYETQQKRRNQLQEQIDSLIDMRSRNLLDDEEYTQSKNRFKLAIVKLDDDLRLTEGRADNWLELTEQVFDFATYARAQFQNGNLIKKRQILTTLGGNFTLLNGKLSITPNEWLIPIEKDYPSIEKSYLKVRTNKNATSSDREMALASISENWRASGDSNPGHPA